MKTFLRLSLLVLLALADVVDARAAAGMVQNVDRHGLALQGRDPVAYFTAGRPMEGRSDLTSTLHGATYRFASAANKAAFDREPARYEPQFGGYCAYGVSRGKLVEIDPEAFQIVDGRLLLQYSRGVREKFSRDVAGNLKLADERWKELGRK